MSWHQRRTSLFVAIACGILSAACDDDLGFGDDDDADYDEAVDEDSKGGGGGGVSTSSSSTVHVSSDRPSASGAKPDTEDETPIDDDDDTVVVIDTSEHPYVTVEQGELEGHWVDNKVRAFLGVPYAEPPIGDLRWAPAQKPAAWSKTLLADTYGNRCAQLASSAFDTDPSSDEDCLYLNVWAPESKTQKAPVLFWIHGGDHAHGSASESGSSAKSSYYDGTALAARGYVVVSVNYRLGALGFFANRALDDEDSQSGNQGLADQQFALRWVKKNIAKFGGDPANVTIFGQGSGATDVCLHVVSPTSQNLFQQAISQSGACTTYQPTTKDVAAATQQWVNKLGCGEVDDVLKCLRGKTTQELLAKVPATNSPFTAIVDGTILPDQPRYLFEAGDFEPVPYILGSNTYDGTWFSDEFDGVTTEAEFHQLLTEKFPGVSLETLCEIYPHDAFGNTPTAYQRQLARLFGDARFNCAVTDTAVLASKAGVPVYLYNFDVSDDVEGVGAHHGAELGYVFGTDKTLTADQRKVSDSIQTYWTTLARYGDVENDDLLAWPQFTTKNDVRINFSTDPEIVDDFHSRECVFWSGVYASQFDAPL